MNTDPMALRDRMNAVRNAELRRMAGEAAIKWRLLANDLRRRLALVPSTPCPDPARNPRHASPATPSA